MNSLFYIKNVDDYNSRFFKIDCPSERYMDNMLDEVTPYYILSKDTPCYERIYSGIYYKIDLTEPNMACSPPLSVSTGFTKRTFKFVVANNLSSCTIYKTPSSRSYIFYIHYSNGDAPGTLRTSFNFYSLNDNWNLGNLTAGTYYVTISQYSSNEYFLSDKILMIFPDTVSNPILPENNELKYKSTFISGKKYYIIFNGDKYPLNYKCISEQIFTGQYILSSLVVEIPSAVTINENTLYPIYCDILSSNTVLNVNSDSVTNIASLGVFDNNDSIILNDFNFTLTCKNKHTYLNFYTLKDLLFLTGDCTSNLRCDILHDSTIIFENVVIGDNNWFNLNIYLLSTYNVNDIYYDMWYVNNECNFTLKNQMDFFNCDTTIPFLNSMISNIIQNDSSLNCIMLDKDLSEDNDSFNILNIKKTYRKYYDLIDYKNLQENKTISTIYNIDYSNIYGNVTILNSHLFSDTGFFNKADAEIFSLLQYINYDSTDYIYMECKFSLLNCIDGTTYNIINDINIPINISDSTINDSIYYGEGKLYIEILKNDIIISMYIDIDEGQLFYQSNLDKITDLSGLKYYPIKSSKDGNIYLSRMVVENLGNDSKGIIYNYKVLRENFHGQYIENLINDTICPYNNIYISDDKGYIIFELNEDVCVYNKNNKLCLQIDSSNTYYNLNNSVNSFNGTGELFKIENNFFEIPIIDSDDIIVENNLKYENGEYAPVIAFENINIELLSSVKLLEQNIPIEKDVIFIITQKDNYLNNYPLNVILYKKNNEKEIKLPSHLLNFNLDMIDEYYYIKRILMKNNISKYNYIYNLNT